MIIVICIKRKYQIALRACKLVKYDSHVIFLAPGRNDFSTFDQPDLLSEQGLNRLSFIESNKMSDRMQS